MEGINLVNLKLRARYKDTQRVKLATIYFPQALDK